MSVFNFFFSARGNKKRTQKTQDCWFCVFDAEGNKRFLFLLTAQCCFFVFAEEIKIQSLLEICFFNEMKRSSLLFTIFLAWDFTLSYCSNGWFKGKLKMFFSQQSTKWFLIYLKKNRDANGPFWRTSKFLRLAISQNRNKRASDKGHCRK